MFRRRGPKRRKRMDSGEAIALVVLGLFLGTIFTVGMRYWNQPIAREDAISVDAAFAGFREAPGHEKSKLKIGSSAIVTGSGSAVPIILEFSDHAHLQIDGSCVNDALLMQLQALQPGDALTCLVHPNSNTVMEIVSDGALLMRFDDAVKRLSSEQRGFFILGLVMYAGALYGALNLLPRKRR